MRVLIPAAGDGTRWGQGSKHLAPVAGQTVIGRLTGQAARHTTDIVIVGSPKADGARNARPRLNPSLGDIDKIASSQHLWNPSGRTVVLFGDVVLTDHAADMILGDDDRDWKVYGRWGPSVLGKRYGELFALSFWPHDHHTIRALIGKVADIRPNRLWHLYRAGVGLPVSASVPPTSRFVPVDDWSDDIDFRDEWETIRRVTDTRVTVVVPFDRSPDRTAQWRWVSRWYRTRHPSWRVVIADDPVAGEFSKPRAVNAAARRLRTDVLVIADADLYVPPAQLETAVALSLDAPWVVPQSRVNRLDEPSTARLMAGGGLDGATFDRRYEAVSGGGLFVIRRDLFLKIGGFDERFGMWGAEDQAFQVAADTLLGRHVKLPGELWHLWHPPMERVGTDRWKTNVRLLKRYRERRGNPAAIADLLGLDGTFEGGDGVKFVNVKTGEEVVVEDGSKAAALLSRRPGWQQTGRVPVEHKPAPVIPDRPPRSGPGSGRAAWARYAQSVGLNVDGLSRTVIMEMVDGN